MSTPTSRSLASGSSSNRKHPEGSLDLAKQLVELRRSCGLSQTRLAERSGIPQSEISRIERGVANPTAATLRRLAAVLDANLAIIPN